MNLEEAIPVPPLPPGGTVDVSAEMISPEGSSFCTFETWVFDAQNPVCIARHGGCATTSMACDE
jgi:hypothetical protein